MTTGVCPLCEGSTRRPVPPDFTRRWLPTTAGWDEATDTFPCDNCGGQKMFTRPSGRVPLRPDGTPCLHEYLNANIGPCRTRYTCRHCADVYIIDSGD